MSIHDDNKWMRPKVVAQRRRKSWMRAQNVSQLGVVHVWKRRASETIINNSLMLGNNQSISPFRFDSIHRRWDNDARHDWEWFEIVDKLHEQSSGTHAITWRHLTLVRGSRDSAPAFGSFKKAERDWHPSTSSFHIILCFSVHVFYVIAAVVSFPAKCLSECCNLFLIDSSRASVSFQSINSAHNP